FFPDVLRVVAEFVILIQPTCLPVSLGHGSDVVDPPKEAEEEEGSCSPVRRLRPKRHLRRGRREVLDTVISAVAEPSFVVRPRASLLDAGRSTCSTDLGLRVLYCMLPSRYFGSPFVGCVDFSYIYLSCLSGL